MTPVPLGSVPNADKAVFTGKKKTDKGYFKSVAGPVKIKSKHDVNNYCALDTYGTIKMGKETVHTNDAIYCN